MIRGVMKTTLLSKITTDWHAIYEGQDWELLIKPLTAIERASIDQSVSYDDIAKQFVFSDIAYEKLIKAGLKDWRNLQDEDGNEILYSFEKLNELDPSHIEPIAMTILSVSRLNDEDKKKS